MHSLPRKLTQYLLIILTCYALLHSLIAVAELGSVASQPNGEIATDVQLVDLADSLDNNKPIDVTRRVSDDLIKKRIENILTSSEWFTELKVTSSEGIVTLVGVALEPDFKDWAGSVANRTEGVVAVINKLSLDAGDEISFAPVLTESQLLWRKTIKALPSLGISCVVLLIFYVLARYAAALSQKLTRAKIESVMLRRLIANLVAAPVMLMGIYLVLRITGLGQIAITILGGTGLIGLVLGFAFRDIAENFLASILISIQRPFRLGETIQVLNHIGVVQAVTTRGTVLMTLEGNHVQVPNTIIYKESITNFSANPHLRLDFLVGIGYDASIAEAQSIALQVLLDHPAVLVEPEPWVLAEALSASTVNLRIYFWVNNSLHNALKVKSAIIRNIKYAFLDKNISMPDDAREVIFPQGIKIHTDAAVDAGISAERPNAKAKQAPEIKETGDNKERTEAEANLDTDIPAIKSQASRYSLDEGDTNLL